MSDLISRQTVLRCIKESRDNIDWGQSEDGDAFLHYTGALYRTVASEECLPSAEPDVIRCKDCKHYAPEAGDDSYALGYCPFIGSHLVMSKGFCAWGERREG